MMERIMIMGSTGFIGRNISEKLQTDYNLLCTSRSKNEGNHVAEFDLLNEATWQMVHAYQPTVIINCAGYGVVRSEIETELMYKVNYFQTIRFYQYLRNVNYSGRLFHFGTAFEYDLSVSELSETSPTIPLTHYGISKLMTSNYLIQAKFPRCLILRPFNLFGKFEDESKIVPALIISQRRKVDLKLSSGTQCRDYLSVNDLANFVEHLISKWHGDSLPEVVNVGSNTSKSILELSGIISRHVLELDSSIWKWGLLPPRTGEFNAYRNDSNKAFSLGLKVSSLETALIDTINYYWN